MAEHPERYVRPSDHFKAACCIENMLLDIFNAQKEGRVAREWCSARDPIPRMAETDFVFADPRLGFGVKGNHDELKPAGCHGRNFCGQICRVCWLVIIVTIPRCLSGANFWCCERPCKILINATAPTGQRCDIPTHRSRELLSMDDVNRCSTHCRRQLHFYGLAKSMQRQWSIVHRSKSVGSKECYFSRSRSAFRTWMPSQRCRRSAECTPR